MLKGVNKGHQVWEAFSVIVTLNKSPQSNLSYDAALLTKSDWNWVTVIVYFSQRMIPMLVFNYFFSRIGVHFDLNTTVKTAIVIWSGWAGIYKRLQGYNMHVYTKTHSHSKVWGSLKNVNIFMKARTWKWVAMWIDNSAKAMTRLEVMIFTWYNNSIINLFCQMNLTNGPQHTFNLPVANVLLSSSQ